MIRGVTLSVGGGFSKTPKTFLLENQPCEWYEPCRHRLTLQRPRLRGWRVSLLARSQTEEARYVWNYKDRHDRGDRGRALGAAG